MAMLTIEKKADPPWWNSLSMAMWLLSATMLAAVFQPRNQVSNTFDICGRENTIRFLDGGLLRCITATATVVPIEPLRLRVDR